MLRYERSWGLAKAHKDYDQGNYEEALRRVNRVIAKATRLGVQPGPGVLKLRDDAARALEEQRRRASVAHTIPVHDDDDSEEEEEEEEDGDEEVFCDDDEEGVIVVEGPEFPDPQELPVYTPTKKPMDGAIPHPTATETAEECWTPPVYRQMTVAEAAREAAKKKEETRDEIEKLRESVLYQRGPVGFQNKAGENNCFLNVVLQVLFLLPPFATEFVATTKHTHDERCCVFCALKGIFADYQFGDDRAIPPTAMRRALSTLCAPESRFAMHAAEDAAEALECILGELHAELTDGHRDADAPCTPPCLVHRVFGLELVQQDVCAECGARSRPLVAREWVLYCPVESVVVEYHRSGSLERSIAQALAEDAVACPARAARPPCAGQTARRTTMLRAQPAVLALGLAWPSSTPATATARTLVDALALTLDVDRLFFPHSTARGAPAAQYVLRGIVCFYGRHYVLFFMDRDKHQPDWHAKRWWFLDDSIVRAVGPWGAVQPFIKQNCFHPTVLLYTKV